MFLHRKVILLVKIFIEKEDLVHKLSLNQKERRAMSRFIQTNNLDLDNRSDFIKVTYEFV